MTTGVQETKELLVAAIRAGLFTIKLTKDGLDLSDGVAVIKALADEEFRKVIVDGAVGIEKVPAELKDIDAAEAVELLTLLLAEIKK
jgi:hypothetical protein